MEVGAPFSGLPFDEGDTMEVGEPFSRLPLMEVGEPFSGLPFDEVSAVFFLSEYLITSSQPLINFVPD
jgi:hypothetical protein